MKSYESSTNALRAILGHPSLQRESIEATMDALAEANADAREVDDAVRVGGDLAVGVDDSDLEEELKALAREAEAEAEAEPETEAARVASKLGSIAVGVRNVDPGAVKTPILAS